MTYEEQRARTVAQIAAYRPMNAQEERDQALMLQCLEHFEDVFERTNALCHMTASAWICNPSRDKVLLAWHNIYRSWAWLGGHADGEPELLSVALREAREESGLERVRPLCRDICSLEILAVDGHVKRGQYVSSHIHLNVTYLLEADDTECVRIKPDENSGVGWFSLEEAVKASGEAWYQEKIYTKLNHRLISYR